MEWIAYCRTCNKELDAEPKRNGEWVKGMARLHATEGLTFDGSARVKTGHTVIVGFILKNTDYAGKEPA